MIQTYPILIPVSEMPAKAKTKNSKQEKSGKKSLKAVLVNVPLTRKKLQGQFQSVANVLPPLGIGYIAALLEQHGFSPEIIDCMPLNMSIEELVDELRCRKPDVVAFSSTVLFINATKEAAQMLKEALSETVIVLGGPHVTSLPQETMQWPYFDIGVLHEGEYTFLELAEALEKNRNLLKDKAKLSKIKGIVFRDSKGELVFTKQRPLIENLDELPFPARHLFPPLEKYSPVEASFKRRPYAHLMSSRGCPYQCIFCDSKIFGHTVRMRSPKNVIEELELLVNEYGVREVRFFDDTFTFSKERVLELCRLIKERTPKLIWTAITRVNKVDPGLLSAMADAGCWQISYGLESGNQHILNIMKKGTTLEQGRAAVKWTKQAGMETRAYFIFGMPGESAETINNTVQFAKSLDLDVVTFYNVTLMPGNELYQIAKREGKILHDDYEHYNPSISDETRFAYVPEGMTEEDLIKAIRRAHREYYFRPRYILNKLLSIRSFADMHRYWAGLKLIARM